FGDNLQAEPLGNGSVRLAARPVIAGAVTFEHLLIEDVPMQQAAVAAQIELAATDAADGHADRIQIAALINGPLAFGRERLDPLRIELFIGRDKMIGRDRSGRRYFR